MSCFFLSQNKMATETARLLHPSHKSAMKHEVEEDDVMMQEETSCSSSPLALPSLTFLTKEPMKRARLIDINEWITCYLCGGYLVDATTLIDCSTLHSFCRSCILKYLNECQESRSRPTCPVCETAMNETKPHASLRLDRKLQDIVYKLVPGLFKSKFQLLYCILYLRLYRSHLNHELDSCMFRVLSMHII